MNDTINKIRKIKNNLFNLHYISHKIWLEQDWVGQTLGDDNVQATQKLLDQQKTLIHNFITASIPNTQQLLLENSWDMTQYNRILESEEFSLLVRLYNLDSVVCGELSKIRVRDITKTLMTWIVFGILVELYKHVSEETENE